MQTLELDAIAFQYQREDGQGMRVGPVSLTVRRGECLFITGGNGSGKTTLAKVIAGLYEADEGEMRIDGRRVRGAEASDYAAVVFSPCYVFDRAYGLNVSQDRVGAELERLGLTDRVTRVNDWIDRTALSSGQRKRVALMEACLQDRPILILDEVAADQDPEFRRAYYEQILPASTRRGHIVIVISHDDRWFHLADRVLKLDLGRPVAVDRAERVPA